MEIQNCVAEVRRACGASVQQLSKLTGVSTQTIYGIESERYLPNISVALKLAWALGVQVEELFQLTERPNYLQPVRVDALKTAGTWSCP